MKKILMSLTTISAMAVLVIGATGAYFTDVETSAGNTFEAGSIDLKLDNTSYLSDGRNSEGYYIMRASTEDEGTTWGQPTPIDLNGRLFFNFHDLKPEDLGEDTISLHVESNKAWACLDIDVTEDQDVTCTNSEVPDDTNCAPGNDGELDKNLQFLFWRDDGDNVLEEGEQLLTENPYTVEQLNGAKKWKLADSNPAELGVPAGTTDPLEPGQTYYIGKAWCFGQIGVPDARLANDSMNGPNVRGPGVECDGSSVDNAAQTDKVVGTMTFTAYQYRNNENFTCASQRRL